MPHVNPTPDDIRALLERVKTIAVVGISPRADRPSHHVARALQGFGYRIVPVRPAVDGYFEKPSRAARVQGGLRAATETYQR